MYFLPWGQNIYSVFCNLTHLQKFTERLNVTSQEETILQGKSWTQFIFTLTDTETSQESFLASFYLCQSRKGNVTPEFRGFDPLKISLVCRQLYFKHHSEAQSCGERQHRMMWRHMSCTEGRTKTKPLPPHVRIA